MSSETSSDAPRRALALVAAHTVMSLATLVEGAPHAVSLMYAHDGFTLYWVSDPNTRHSAALERATLASVTIATQFDDFRRISGLQMQGHGCRVTDGLEAEAGLNLLRGRYDFLDQVDFGSPQLEQRLELASVYRFSPFEIVLVDNTRGFGHKDTFTPPSAV